MRGRTGKGRRLEALLVGSAAIVGLVGTTACGLPRDPDGTLERIRGGTMRVGVIEHPPWATTAEGEPAGVEVEVIEALAEALESRVRWTPGSESELIEALELGELDAVVGGLTADAPWISDAAFTAPYVITKTLVGVPPGQPTAIDLAGLEVQVERGSPAAGLLRAAGAVPVEVDQLRGDAIAAVDEWLLDDLGLQASDAVLEQREHVFALPLGENAWVVAVDEFLGESRVRVGELLEAVERS
jgi:polar amino acid transport system substrate-binding protein